MYRSIGKGNFERILLSFFEALSESPFFFIFAFFDGALTHEERKKGKENILKTKFEKWRQQKEKAAEAKSRRECEGGFSSLTYFTAGPDFREMKAKEKKFRDI